MKRTDEPKGVSLTELRDDLGRYVDRASSGEEITITDRGRPVARLSPLRDAVDELIAQGRARPPLRPRRPASERPAPIKVKGTVSDLIRR
ncbi:MAG: type II toxin-antitoxin system prevent-host-death family antitoxin [Actinomycetota bacterium]